MPQCRDQALFQDVIRRRRSVRKFEPGRTIEREVLERIIDCGRWAPSGANVQCWDFIVVDDPAMRDQVMAVFLRQAQRLVDHAKGFPAVKKTYLANTGAIVLVLGDPRWKACFPQATTAEWDTGYRANNEAIFLCSLGAAIQNIQLGVAAEGLTSAWLSGGGEDETNRELAAILGYPAWMKAYGTIPIGYPAVDQNRRYRRPLARRSCTGTATSRASIAGMPRSISTRAHCVRSRCTGMTDQWTRGRIGTRCSASGATPSSVP